MTEPRREFYDVRKAFPLNPVDHRYVAQLEMGYYDAGDETGEWSVNWVDLGRYGPSPQLHIFDDAWEAFHATGAAEVFAGLGKRSGEESFTIDELRARLTELGWVDRTEEYAAKWAQRESPRSLR